MHPSRIHHRRPPDATAPRTAHAGAAWLALLGTLIGGPASLAAQGGVAGVVTDSVAGGAPLAGATVQLVAQARLDQVHSATADSAGRFVIRGVPAGRYLLGFLHPRLDELVLGVPMRVVQVPDSGVEHVDLAVASAATIRTATCRPAAGDSTGLLLGRVVNADDGLPVAEGAITMSWPELLLAGRGLRQERRTARATVDADGRFALCGIPTDLPVVVTATSGAASSGDVELHVPPLGMLTRDLHVARPDTAAPPTPARRPRRGAAAPAPLRRGTARLAGRVLGTDGRPVASAQVLVHGTGLADTTDADGTFALAGLPAGSHTLEARAIGFTPVRVPVDLAGDRPRAMDVVFDAPAARLDAVTIFGRTTRRTDLTEFTERSRGGFGNFVTAADIARRIAYDLPDVLRTVPGVRVLPSEGVDTHVLVRGCVPAVFLNGMEIYEGARMMTTIITPADIAGIEVYNSVAEVPVEYRRGSCGSIVLWSKGRLP